MHVGYATVETISLTCSVMLDFSAKCMMGIDTACPSCYIQIRLILTRVSVLDTTQKMKLQHHFQSSSCCSQFTHLSAPSAYPTVSRCNLYLSY